MLDKDDVVHIEKGDECPVTEISIEWSIEDVQERRPDLTEAQCSSVLVYLEEHHDAKIGINWCVIDTVTDMMYPEEAKLSQERDVSMSRVNCNECSNCTGDGPLYRRECLFDMRSAATAGGGEPADLSEVYHCREFDEAGDDDPDENY